MTSGRQRYRHIPKQFVTFDSLCLLQEYIRQQGAPIVVKADGLAAGKGVVVAQSVEEAEAAVDAMLVDAVFGSAGETALQFFTLGFWSEPLIMKASCLSAQRRQRRRSTRCLPSATVGKWHLAHGMAEQLGGSKTEGGISVKSSVPFAGAEIVGEAVPGGRAGVLSSSAKPY